MRSTEVVRITTPELSLFEMVLFERVLFEAFSISTPCLLNPELLLLMLLRSALLSFCVAIIETPSPSFPEIVLLEIVLFDASSIRTPSASLGAPTSRSSPIPTPIMLLITVLLEALSATLVLIKTPCRRLPAMRLLETLLFDASSIRTPSLSF